MRDPRNTSTQKDRHPGAMMRFWALSLACTALIAVAVTAKELCHREINATNGGQFEFGGYSAYGKTYCSVSGALDPIVYLVALMLFISMLILPRISRRAS